MPSHDKFHAHDYRPKIITIGFILVVGWDGLVATHITKVNFYNKSIECLNEEWQSMTLKKKGKLMIVWIIIVLQLNRCNRKGCELYVVQATNESEIRRDRMEEHPIIK